MTQTPAPRSSAPVGRRREPSLGERALAGEATALRPDLFAAIATARLASASYQTLLFSHHARRVSLSEEAEILSRVPPAAMFEKLARDLREVMAEPAHDQRNRILIGLMVDAFPNGRPERLGTYQDALAFDLLDTGAPPTVVAQALRQVRRGRVFLPAISEVLEAVAVTLRERTGMLAALEVDRDRRTSWADSLGRRMARAAAAETTA